MNLAATRLLWRNITGELDTSVVPDVTAGSLVGVDDWLIRGAEALNDLVGYFFKDSTISLAAGAESALPDDMIEVVFVTLGDTQLHKTDIEQLQVDHPNWRNEPAGMPSEFYLYSKIGFFPKLDATAAALTCTMRHTATPTLTAGFELLASQHQRIPVYGAAALWFEAHGLDGDGFRAGMFQKRFEQEAAVVKPYYQRRQLARGPARMNTDAGQ